MAYALGARANNKSIAVTMPATSGLHTPFSGAAVSIPAYTVVIEGIVPSGGAFGASGFCDLLRVVNGSANNALYTRMSPTVGNGQLQNRPENTAGLARPSSISLASGTNGSLLENARFTLALHMSAARVNTTTYVYGESGTTVVEDTPAAAYAAGTGLWKAITATVGYFSSFSWPGDLTHVSVVSGALSVAQVQAIHAAKDPGFFFHTHRAAGLWSNTGFLKAEAYSSTEYALPGEAVTANNVIVFDSADGSADWFPASTASVGTVAIGAGSIAFIRPPSPYTPNTSIVPDGGYDLTTEVQNRAINPALYDVGRGIYRKATHVAVTANSRGQRTATDPENRQTTNDSYHSSQPASIAQNWAEGLGVAVPANRVGICRSPSVSTRVSSFSAWNGAMPKTGTSVNKSGSGSNVADLDFARVGAWRNGTNTGHGPSEYVQLATSAGLDQIFSACDGIAATDPVRVWVCFRKYPNSATATIQKVSHASTGSTVPFGSSAANWTSGTEHGAESSPITLSNSVGSATVVSYSSGSLVVLADPGIHIGEALVVDRGGVECLGIVETTDGSGNITTEHDMGDGTEVPQPGDDVYFGGAIDHEWAYVDFDGSETPNAWRGVRIRAGATGFPVHIVDLLYQKLDANSNPAPGLIIHPNGWSGNSYSDTYAAISSTVFASSDGGDGLNTWQRMWKRKRAVMLNGGAAYSQCCVAAAPAQQSGTPASMDQFFDDLDTAGFARSEQAFFGDVPNAANSNTMATAAYQEWPAYGLTIGPARGIVAINVWNTTGVPFSQVAWGMRSDISHFSTYGVKFVGTEWIRVLAPVSQGGGGAAMPARRGGYRSRPSRSRLGR